MALTRFKLVFFVPKENTRAVLSHLFSKFPNNLGKIGNYEQCAFIQRGTGQFKPVNGANPTIGSVGDLEQVEEDRLEITLNDNEKAGKTVRSVVNELKSVHPYEEVAYDVYKLEDF
ncbi:hypothetical protein AGABI1DRAFT_84112 [Agaricus bisporus var. burnettii JB137-S8]|nr:uncharacterized protein AGABI1DRAFT_84112 [Agaricus bisporus var. burnettii JB137-S8]EKM81182.1 hypothetical protein AGABI1DRAFT_84112 [Agaricus bisporus var. burnettii JB137-S8]